jgi:hypothetical protein
MVLNIEEEVHLVEKIKKNKKLAEDSYFKSAHDHPLDSLLGLISTILRT